MREGVGSSQGSVFAPMPASRTLPHFAVLVYEGVRTSGYCGVLLSETMRAGLP
jgi:hypothetical protein